jgi:mono/diheme cytochrome c family protein
LRDGAADTKIRCAVGGEAAYGETCTDSRAEIATRTFWMERPMKAKFRAGLPFLAVLPMLALAQEPTIAMAQAQAAAAAAPETPYKVVDGDKVDEATFSGWKTWRSMACERCHGANQEGLVGPSLVKSLQTLTKQDFVFTVTHGRIEKGMPNFGEVESVVKNIDSLYAYLKGRSDGAIKPGHLHKIETQ